MRNSGINNLRIVIILICALTTLNCNSQTLGNWLNTAGTLPDNQAQSPGSVGIGVGPWTTGARLESWTQIRWCPPLSGPDEAGLFLTLKKCNTGSYLMNPNQFQSLPIDGNGSSYEPAPLPSYAFTSFLPLGTYPTSSNPNTTFISGVNSGREPLFWARTEEPGSGGPTTPGMETQFIVLPNGHTGINISAPRAALDVRTWGLNTPTAIFGMHALRGYISHPNPPPGVQYRFSRHLAIIPFLGAAGYNNKSQKGDIGLIYTDGMGSNGENIAGSLLIAPWSAISTAGGIKIDAIGNVTVHKSLTVEGGLQLTGYYSGNMEVRGEILCNGLKSKPQWWPDFVFHNNYDLLSLDSLSTYIDKHKHLPGMPSQDSILRHGQEVANLQVLQQQKIEELTLYLIQLNKTIEALKIESDRLSARLASKCDKE